MKLFLFAVLVLACSASSAFADDYDPIRSPTYEEQAAAQAVFESFAQRHAVLKVYTSQSEGPTRTITFQIQGFDCIATVSDVTCYLPGHLNGYEYHENRNGRLVRGQYIRAFSNHPLPTRKQCVYFSRLITYYAECR